MAALPDGDMNLMRAISALSGKLEDVVTDSTCIVCLEPMTDACQMRCGHMFCSTCMEQILTKSSPVRCPLCKAPANKRGIRPSPIPMPQIVACFQRLQALVKDAELAASGEEVPRAGAQPVVTQIPPRTPSGKTSSSGSSTCPPTPFTPFDEDKTDCGRKPNCCVFCPRGIDPATVAPGTDLGVLFPARMKKRADLKVHEECAFFAEIAHKKGPHFHDVDRALRASRGLVCARDACGRDRATVPCAKEGCPLRYHYVCAVASGCTIVDDGSFAVFCKSHAHLAPKVSISDFTLNQVDPEGTQGRESPDQCVKCDVGGNLLLCDDCDEAYHVVCAGLSKLPLGHWSCPKCVERKRGSASGNASITPKNPVQCLPCPGASQRSGDSGLNRKRKFNEPLRPLSENLRMEGGWGSTERPSQESLEDKRRRRGSLMRVLPTGLNPDQTLMLNLAKRKFGGNLIVESSFRERVTHILINIECPDGLVTRTVKLCQGVAANKGIVCMHWLNSILEGEFRTPVGGDLHQLSRSSQDERLFLGKLVYFEKLSGARAEKEELIEIAKAGKGTVVSSEPTETSIAGVLRSDVFIVRPQDTESMQRRRIGSTQRARRSNLRPKSLPTGVVEMTADEFLALCVPLKAMK